MLRKLLLGIILFSGIALAQSTADLAFKYTADWDTTNTQIDTIPRVLFGTSVNTMESQVKRWWKVTITPTDTIEFSKSINFPANNTRKIHPGEKFILGPVYKGTDIDSLFVRRFVISGAAGDGGYNVDFEGN